jgi:hypothetical protein
VSLFWFILMVIKARIGFEFLKFSWEHMMSPKMSMIVIRRLLMVKIDDNFKKVINEVEFDSTNDFL